VKKQAKVSKGAAVQPEALKAMLKDRGLRVTEPRLAVLRELHRDGTAVSHADLTDRLVPKGFDRVTVYRTLITLTDVGLLVKTDLGDHVWRFELSSEKGKTHTAHPHFICVDCGSVDCLPAGSVSIRLEGALGRSVQEVQVKGRCDECLAT
jgi:Fur family transcriptional regulator, ferric uptake regulator